jgi:hypothetical protein
MDTPVCKDKPPDVFDGIDIKAIFADNISPDIPLVIKTPPPVFITDDPANKFTVPAP